MTARHLLAIDPASVAPGLAYFRGGILVAATTIKMKGDASRRILDVGAACLEWFVDRIDAVGPDVGGRVIVDVVIEWSKIYANNKAKKNRRVDPANILVLAGAAGSIMGAIGCTPWTVEDLERPEPAEWIGQLPKGEGKTDPRESPRGALIASCLTPPELELLPLEHDAYDAAGLGLWKLHRLKHRQRFARPGDPGVAKRA